MFFEKLVETVCFQSFTLLIRYILAKLVAPPPQKNCSIQMQKQVGKGQSGMLKILIA
jgi:hypothetical protein